MSRSSSITNCAYLMVAWLTTIGLARAQPVGASIPSAEWSAARARVVVRGVVEDVEKIEHGNCVVTIRVLETLKGERVERLKFVCAESYGSVNISALRATGQQVMLFLDDWVRKHFSRTGGHYAFTRFPLTLNRLILLSPKRVKFAEVDLPVYARDLTPQRTPETLTKTIRSYLKNRPRGELLRATSVSLPPELRGGYYRVAVGIPDDAPRKDKIIGFAAFKERFGGTPPKEKKPPYLRTQSGYVGIHALELMAADCDVVVRGVIEDWCFVAAKDDPTGPTCGARLRVTESLKGGPRAHASFLVTDARDLARLMADGQEVVVFLRDSRLDMPSAALGLQSRDGLWDDSVIVLDERHAEALFADMTWHRDPDEILKRLRAVIKRDDVGNMNSEAARLASQGHVGPPVFDFHPPASLAAGASIAGNRYSKLYLPIDAELEANAQRWAKSDNQDLRWLAARALVYFKSDKNAAILKELLRDKAAWERQEMFAMLEGTPLAEPELLVAWEAWHVLRGWGYDVAKPKFVQQED